MTEERGDESRPRDKTQHGAWGLLPGPQKLGFFVLPNKMEAFDLWTASICLEQVETRIHVCYYELSVVTEGKISKRGWGLGGGAVAASSGQDLVREDSAGSSLPVDGRHRSTWVRCWITLNIISRCGSPGVAFGKSQVLAVGGTRSGTQRREKKKVCYTECVTAQRGRTRL